MSFIETRGNDTIKPQEVAFSYAILNPSASFGGLYIPKELPHFSAEFIQECTTLSYKELAFLILKSFKVDIEDEDLETALNLYDAFDDKNNPSPVVKVKENLFVNEQYHGPTRAFKDMALQPFGSVLSAIAKKRGENYLILAATSGDTGPAALNTFKNKEGIKVACLYPVGGTSDVQRLQMVTEDGKNLKVIGINGDFDDAQNALKSLLASDTFKATLLEKHTKLSAANSVNFGRIIFQIVYHFWSYLELLRQGEIELGEKIYLTVPSGNFGNALGGYYAKKMGLPIEKILITSNANNVLTSWINDGVYDLNDKKLVLTKSPAMDILKSSNIERIMYDMFGSERTKELMDDLNSKNCFQLTQEEKTKLQSEFSATFSDDAYGLKTIKTYLENGYLMDPHTATCIKAYETLMEKPLKNVVYSTAEWTKFSPSVLNALREDNVKYSDKEALEKISNDFNVKVPEMIVGLFDKEIQHTCEINIEDLEEEIIKFL
ncbi:MAG: threonine synthase [Arcobacteraceae bacterium]|jgi:threonine synthase|nr:threonine synthase [Arcobacteraceae bacterium]